MQKNDNSRSSDFALSRIGCVLEMPWNGCSLSRALTARNAWNKCIMPEPGPALVKRKVFCVE